MPNHNVITVLILWGTWITVHAVTDYSEQPENQTLFGKISGRTCYPGWTGHNCTKECPEGSYGMNCAFNCSIHCVYKMCNPKSGNCTYGCEYGWSGVFCDDDILTPEELKEQAIIMFFEFIGGIMGFYLLQIGIIKYRSLHLGCCCCCIYCPCNRDKLERKRRLMRKLKEQQESTFIVEMEPLKVQCNNKCSSSSQRIVHVV
ncbi:scavenger receptor class F member 2-like [Mytilus edulis]|uniref:scavenger receptor class F member 2-like n=1 Tax=Mytilus edulis TaxID=6550 RepID=UPI0039F0D8AD